MNKIALMVIYNHRYDRNIPRIEELYRNRFSNIFHIIPFYDGNKDNVISVYDSSYYFQNYIAQAYQQIKKMEFTHYFIVADDMILNPRINENSLWNEMGLLPHECYISRLTIPQIRKDFWYWLPDLMKYKIEQSGVEIKNILPSLEEAKKQFDLHKIPYSRIPIKRLLPPNWNILKERVIKKLPLSRELKYPLVGGYSDILMITSDVMPKFCQYCGAFAATKLFVEIAIPTSIVLSSKVFKTDVDLGIKRGDWASNVIDEMVKDCHFSISQLLEKFPEGYLYLHPIKLSRWMD